MQGGLRYRLAFLLAAGGLGLCGYAGLQWRALPHFSEEDLKASTELNLQIDLARQGLHDQLGAEQMEVLRRQELNEIESEIGAERDKAMCWLAAGLALLAFASGQMVLIRLTAQTSVH